MIDTPNTTSDVSSITVGPDGNLWFTDYGGAIGKIVW
jgi:streptogramin lyase